MVYPKLYNFSQLLLLSLKECIRGNGYHSVTRLVIEMIKGWSRKQILLDRAGRIHFTGLHHVVSPSTDLCTNSFIIQEIITKSRPGQSPPLVDFFIDE